MPARPIYDAVTWMALVAGLALPSAFPELANVLFFIAAGLALFLCARGTDWINLVRHPGIILPILAMVMLCVAFAFTARMPLHALAAVYFLPLLLIAPLVALFERARHVVTVEAIGLLASVGAASAAGVALYDKFAFGQVRAGTLVNNPIHFAALAMTLGFVALAGLSSTKPSVRLLVLFAPPLSLLAVVLSGSRGPLLAALPLAGLAVILVLVQVARQRALMTAAFLAMVAISAFVVVWFLGGFQRFAVFAEFPQLLMTGTASDSSTTERLHIYLAAWHSFLTSPIFGHGLFNLADVVREHMPAGVELGDYQHLHNDLADFAVAGGGLGIVAYGLFLIAPIVEAARVPNTRSVTGRLYLALVIAIGYFCMGLTNATFGILSQTMLYAFVVALIVHFSRRDTRRTATHTLTSLTAP